MQVRFFLLALKFYLVYLFFFLTIIIIDDLKSKRNKSSSHAILTFSLKENKLAEYNLSYYIVYLNEIPTE